MFFVRYMLLVMGVGMFVVAGAVVANDLWMVRRFRHRAALDVVAIEPEPVRWRATVALACLAWAPLLIALSIAVGPLDHSRQHSVAPVYAAAAK
jgi:hypothetical protein